MQKLVAGIFGFAALTVGSTVGGEKGDKLEGSWIATAAVSDGKKAPEDVLKKAMLTVTFKGGKYSVVSEGNEVEAGTYKADPSKKPATIDLTIMTGKDKGKTQPGIYKIEGDTLTVALTPPESKERPKNFEPPERGEVTVLKRQP